MGAQASVEELECEIDALTKEITSIIEDHTTALFALQRDIGAVRLEYPMPDPVPDPETSLGAFLAAMKMVRSSEDLTEAIPAPRQVRADDTIDETEQRSWSSAESIDERYGAWYQMLNQVESHISYAAPLLLCIKSIADRQKYHFSASLMRVLAQLDAKNLVREQMRKRTNVEQLRLAIVETSSPAYLKQVRRELGEISREVQSLADSEHESQPIAYKEELESHRWGIDPQDPDRAGGLAEIEDDRSGELP